MSKHIYVVTYRDDDGSYQQQVSGDRVNLESDDKLVVSRGDDHAVVAIFNNWSHVVEARTDCPCGCGIQGPRW